jgi:hypothetical protein
MAYCGHKKEDIEDTSMNSYWKPARPAPSWNPWGQLPPPQQGGGGEEDEKMGIRNPLESCNGLKILWNKNFQPLTKI